MDAGESHRERKGLAVLLLALIALLISAIAAAAAADADRLYRDPKLG